MIEQTTTIVAAIILLAGNVLTLLVNLTELRKIKKEVKDLQVVIKDTKEIREALRKPLEGNWQVKGTFSKFQGIDAGHFSTGEVSFIWIPEKHEYEITYIYSVRKAKSAKDEITSYCRGKMFADYYGSVGSNQKVEINFEIQSRTASTGYDESLSKHFTLKEGQLVKSANGRPLKFLFQFNNRDTVGEVEFIK